jgi:hypothetical protein
MEAAVTGKRTLTTEKKKKIIEEVRAREQAAHPDQIIQVFVNDQSDDAGQPQVRVLRTSAFGAGELVPERRR